MKHLNGAQINNKTGSDCCSTALLVVRNSTGAFKTGDFGVLFVSLLSFQNDAFDVHQFIGSLENLPLNLAFWSMTVLHYIRGNHKQEPSVEVDFRFMDHRCVSYKCLL